MNPQERTSPANDEQYQLCVGASAEDDSACLCPEKDYLIKEEEDALAELRRIKEQATLAKRRVKNLQKQIDGELLNKGGELPDSEAESRYARQDELRAELNECEQKIHELRREWKEWDERRQQATRKKLILLGHIS